MGVSNRATHAIEPASGDLLMPDRNRRLHAARIRDVEDACFESVSVPRDVFSTRPHPGPASGVFKSRITHPEADGPIPRDFASKTMAPSERLGVFSGSGHAHAASSLMSPVSVLVLLVCAAAAFAVFWMGAGHALVLSSGSQQPTARASAPAISITTRTVLPPDPVVTSSIPVKKAPASGTGFSAPMPRPARIERAGSILMIRPAGN
ncbi:hypothetical protein WNZ14_02005 [Hoeflea sp. AS60]|uniref:hypothetical protein n=1 Tax=Hoeflea sp. AS60 TaxID=3135780 RepID=UPI00316D69F3